MSATATTPPTTEAAPAAAADTAPAPNSSLYVGDLHPEVTESHLFEIFSAVGTVASIRICRDNITRRSLGYGYVNFHQHEDAVRALDILNFEAVKGRPCRIMWSQRDPSLRKSGVGNIFVKNLEASIDNQQLYDTFSQFGNILSCKVSTDREGISRGYGFVHYDTDEAANRAISEANGMLLPEKPVYVAKFLRRSERRGVTAWTNCFVKNLPVEWDEAKLQSVFEPFGTVTSLVIRKDGEGASKGFGFVNMENHEDAVKATEGLNGLKVGDMEVTNTVKKDGEDGAEETVEEKITIDKCLFVGEHKSKKERERELASSHRAASMKQAERYAGRNIYVRNLDETVDDKRLLAEFSEWGSITSAVVMKDKEGASKGFGFVCFSSADEATKAVTNMNNKMIDRKPIYVALAQRKEVRKAQLDQMRRQQAMARGMGGMTGYPMNMGVYGPGGRPMAPPMNPMAYPGMPMMPRGGAPMGAGYPGRGGFGYRGRGRGGHRGGRGGHRGPAGGMPMPPMPMASPPAPVAPAAPTPVPAGPTALTAKALAAASPEERQNMIGERLYPLVAAMYPEQAAKITGMLLEMEIVDLLHLLESNTALQDKVNEAMEVLRVHQA